MKVIPAIDIRGGKCVRLQQGDFARETVYDAAPLAMARNWQAAGATLLHIVDLDGAKAGQPQSIAIVRELCRELTIPCELGGGMRTIADIQTALKSGVSRVILGTQLAIDPRLASALLEDVAPEQLVAGIDARDGKVSVQGWQEDLMLEAVDLATELFDHGIRRFIYTDISRDGMFTGSNVEATGALCAAVPDAAVIASGGIGAADHVRQLSALKAANLEGVIVGKALYDGRVDYAELVAAADAD